MWIITRRGAISAVRWKRTGDPHDGQMVVRARTKPHLESLLSVLDDKPNIEITPSSDYRYRAWLPQEEFAELLVRLADEIDYTNFKSEVARFEGFKKKPSSYEDALHKIWGILARLQPGGPYGTGGYGYPTIPKGEPKRKTFAPTTGKKQKGKRRQDGQRTCAECGHVGPPEEFLLVEGDDLCVDVEGCLIRMDDQGLLPNLSLPGV